MIKKYNNILLDYETNAYSTHQPLLIWAIENTSGNILELGAGNSSTLLLNSSTVNSDRKLLTIDDNICWLNEYNHLQSSKHQFICVGESVNSWKLTIDYLSTLNWGFVFVDHATLYEIWSVSRPYAVRKFLDSADYVVAHDSDFHQDIKTDQYFWYEYIPKIKPIPSRNGPPSYLLSKKYNLNNFSLNA